MSQSERNETGDTRKDGSTSGRPYVVAIRLKRYISSTSAAATNVSDQNLYTGMKMDKANIARLVSRTKS